MVQMNLFAEQEKRCDVEKGYWDMMWGEEGGMNWERSIKIYTRTCKIASGKLLHSTGSSVQCCDDLGGWFGGRVGGRLKREELYVTYS